MRYTVTIMTGWLFMLSMVVSAQTVEHGKSGKRIIHLRPDIERGKQAQESRLFSLRDKRKGEADLASEVFICEAMPVRLKDGKTYDALHIPGMTAVGDVGEPALPQSLNMVRIPDGADVRLIIKDVEYVQVEGAFEIMPVQEPEPDVIDPKTGRQPETPFRKKTQAYERKGFQGSPPVRLGERVRVRGREYMSVEYHPVDYDPSTGTLRFAARVEWSLRYRGGRSKGTRARGKARLVPSGKNEAVIDIRMDVEDETQSTESEPLSGSDAIQADLTSNPNQADYLIITADEFVDEIQPLADWKHRKGVKTCVATMSEIGTTDLDVYHFIQTAYSNGVMTRYVLLVGDCDKVPGFKLTGHPYYGDSYVWYSDIPYTYVDGVDGFSDVAVGRLSGDAEAHITTMVNKILNYEKNPPGGVWFNRALLAGYFQDDGGDGTANRWFMEGLHRIADFLGPDYDFYQETPDAYNQGYSILTALNWGAPLTETLQYWNANFTDRFMPIPDRIVPQVWKDEGTGSTADITDTINNGVSFALHRDHGYGNGSGWAHPNFRTADINGLSNGNRLPVVYSMNCASGWYDTKDAAAEAWMRNPDGGAVGHFGAMRVSYSGYNDTYLIGLMDGLWNDYNEDWDGMLYESSQRPAEAQMFARFYLSYKKGYTGYTLATMDMFNWLGDPEMYLRTKVPVELTVNHPSSLSVNQSQTFTVNVKGDGANFENALVALVKDGDMYQTKMTAANGNASFTVTPSSEGQVYITASAPDSVPYLASIPISGDTPPNVSFTSPAEGATVDPDFSVAVNANDENGINRVIFYIDNQWQGADTTAPYTWDFSGVADGEHEIRALAKDNNGNNANAYRTVYVESGSSGGDETFDNMNQSGWGSGSFIGDAGFRWYYTESQYIDGGINGRSLRTKHTASGAELSATIPSAISSLTFKMRNAVENGVPGDYGWNVYVNGDFLGTYTINAFGSTRTVTVPVTPSGSSAQIVFEPYKRQSLIDDISWTADGNGFGMYIQAEDYDLAQHLAPFRVITDASASGGQTVGTQDGAATDWNPRNDDNGVLLYGLSMSDAAELDIWARVKLPDSRSNSFYFRMNEGAQDGEFKDWLTGWSGVEQTMVDWAWINLKAYDLPSGEHTFTLHYRESGALIDRLYFSTDGSAP